MTVHNGEPYLRAAVNSVLAQRFKDFELIVVDDGSEDGTPEILNTYAAQDDRVHITRQANKGSGAAIGAGIVHAKGPYIGIMDADDVALPKRLEKQVDFLEANSDVDVIGCQVQLVDGRGNPLSEDWSLPTSPALLGWHMLFRCCLPHPGVLMRRSVLEEVGGYRPLRFAADYDLWTRMLYNVRMTNHPDVLLKRRVHETSITSTKRQGQLENDVQSAYRLHQKVLGEQACPESVGFLRRLRGGEDALTLLDRIDIDLLSLTRYVAALFSSYTNSAQLAPNELRAVTSDALCLVNRFACLEMQFSRLSGYHALLQAVKISPQWLGHTLLARSSRFFGQKEVSYP